MVGFRLLHTCSILPIQWRKRQKCESTTIPLVNNAITISNQQNNARSNKIMYRINSQLFEAEMRSNWLTPSHTDTKNSKIFNRTNMSHLLQKLTFRWQTSLRVNLSALFTLLINFAYICFSCFQLISILVILKFWKLYLGLLQSHREVIYL